MMDQTRMTKSRESHTCFIGKRPLTTHSTRARRLTRTLPLPRPVEMVVELQLPRGRSESGPASASHLSQQILPYPVDLFSSTPPAAADACISALLSLAIAKSRGPLPAGAQAVRRSVRPSVGTELVSGPSVTEREGEPARRWQKRKQQQTTGGTAR